MMNFRHARRQLARKAASVCAVAAGMLLAQSAVPLYAQGAGTAPPRSLQIMILDGEGALNNIQARTAREPIVQVQDENHKPVAGAVVLFTIHPSESGAGAAFAGGANQLSVTTGPDGTAAAHGLALNHNAGAWQIGVSATDGALAASTVINEISFVPLPQERNEAPREGLSSIHPPHWWVSKPVLLLGGGIVIGSIVTYVVMNPPARTGTLVVPGGSTVGAPAAAIRIPLGK